MMIAAVLMALAWQDAEIDRLRDEIAKLRKENEALRKSVESARTPKVTPRSIEAKVTAVSSEIGLVVLSAGREDGVADGDEFAVVRDGKFVAAVVVDRVDRRWSAARVKAALDTPRVGDDVSNAPREDVRAAAAQALAKVKSTATPVPSSAPAAAPNDLRDIRRELDDIRAQVRALTDHLLPSWEKLGAAVDPLPAELKGHLGLERGLLVRRVKEGSPAERAGLRAWDVLPDVTDLQLAEAIEKGSPLRILRAGREVKKER